LFVLDQALRQYGINAVTFTASPEPGARERAAYLSPLERWDEATLKRMRAQIVSVYDLFLQRVAEGRKLPVEAVRKVAEGRIWSGAQGQERGLVDEAGGIHRALELARALARLDRDAPVRVEGVVESLLELLMLGSSADGAEVSTAVQRFEARQACALRTVPDQLRPFVASLSPLLQGEPMLATLPFALVVR
jgi:protease-4